MATEPADTSSGLVDDISSSLSIVTKHVGPAARAVRLYAHEEHVRTCLLVFAHGGGFSWGTLDDYDQICRNLVAATRGVLASVDYRLAPVHRFPVGLNDVFEVVRWAAATRDKLAGPGAPMILAGDSAGGCLVAGVAQKLRAETTIAVQGQLLIYPMLEYHDRTPIEFLELAKRFRPSFEDIRGAWDHYLVTPTDAEAPYAVPTRTRDLAGLPSGFVITAENDPLRFEGEAYARRLRAAGVATRQRCYPDVGHSFLGNEPDAPGVSEAMADIGDWAASLNKQLAEDC